jgi:hypothetical protein
MHNHYLRSGVSPLTCANRLRRSICAAALLASPSLLLAVASDAFAQAAPPTAAPTTPPPAATPTEPPPQVPPPAGVEPPPPAAASPTAPAETVPPTPPPTSPPPPPPEPGPQYGRLGGTPEQPVPEGDWNPWDHPEAYGNYEHEGFFLRLQLGPGGSSVWREGESWSGAGLGMGLAIGGSPVPNLALHLDLQTTWMFSPSRAVNGIGMQSLGLGVTYYIMPVDLFVSGSVGIGWLAFEDDAGQSKDTSAGIALDALVGKEWWVGSDWGIGVAAQLLYMHVKDYTDDAGMDGLAINALFTATYN